MIEEQCARGIEETVDAVNQLGEAVIFLGDGVPVYKEIIKEKIQVPVSFAPAHVSRQRAGAVGSLAMKYYQQGEIQSARDHGPEYLRKSQAEREREERNAR